MEGDGQGQKQDEAHHQYRAGRPDDLDDGVAVHLRRELGARAASVADGGPDQRSLDADADDHAHNDDRLEQVKALEGVV